MSIAQSEKPSMSLDSYTSHRARSIPFLAAHCGLNDCSASPHRITPPNAWVVLPKSMANKDLPVDSYPNSSVTLPNWIPPPVCQFKARQEEGIHKVFSLGNKISALELFGYFFLRAESLNNLTTMSRVRVRFKYQNLASSFSF